MKKRVVKNMSNKLFYTLVVIGVLILGGVGVFAWTAGGTGNPGHSIQDVAAPTGCSQGQYLRYETEDYECQSFYGSDAPCWYCATPSSGGISCSSCDSRFIQDGDSLTSPNGIGTFKEVWVDDVCNKNGDDCGASIRDMEIVTKTQNSKYLTIDCPSGKKIIGGGCFAGKTGMSIASNFPLDENTWGCYFSDWDSANKAYAICAYID